MISILSNLYAQMCACPIILTLCQRLSEQHVVTGSTLLVCKIDISFLLVSDHLNLSLSLDLSMSCNIFVANVYSGLARLRVVQGENIVLCILLYSRPYLLGLHTGAEAC